REGGCVVTYGFQSKMLGGRMASGSGGRHPIRESAELGWYIVRNWFKFGRKSMIPYSIQWLMRIKPAWFRDAIKENEVYLYRSAVAKPTGKRLPRILAAYPRPRSEFHVRATEGETAMDEQKLQEFLGRALVDLGGAVNAVLMSIGDELGLYKALSKGPQSPAELARNTHTHERYIREWLNSQAAGGYVTFDKASGKYSLSPEQELCLADPAGPVDLPGATLLVQDLFHVRDRALQNFRTGKGMEWGEHHPCLFCGTERFFR